MIIFNTIVDIDPEHYEHYFEHSIFNLFISRQFATSEQKWADGEECLYPLQVENA